MKVVVTGGLGFIGQNLAIHIRQSIPDVTLTAVDWFDGASDAEKSRYDVVHTACFAEASSLAIYHDADFIVHLAARTTVQESLQDPAATFDNNVVKTQIVLEFLRQYAPEVKVIFASTGGAIIGEHDGPIDEDIVPKPLSPYGASKLAVEGLLSAYQASFGLDYASLRFSNVYGPNSARKKSVIATFCKMYLENHHIQINGDGGQTRDYIHVADVAAAIVGVIEQGENGVFQVGTGVSTSIQDIAGIFERISIDFPTDDPFEVVKASPLKGEVRHNVADISKLRSAIGFVPAIGVEDGIRSTLEWFRSQ